MPFTRGVLEGRNVPPDGFAYHLVFEPVAERLLTVTVPPPVQISCEALPVGDGVSVVTTTASLSVLSQPLTVWLAKYVAPFVNSVDEANGVPPVVTSYH